MPENPSFVSTYSGQQIEEAIRKALPLDTFELDTDELVGGKVYHVLWKKRPTAANTVYGFTVHPDTGELYEVCSAEGVITIGRYISESDLISESEINTILGISNS